MSPGHVLQLGTLTDYLTGISLPDTLDERYRQKLARFLVVERGIAGQRSFPGWG